MTFEPEIAKLVGTDAAIILSNIDYWVDFNRSNKVNFHDGQYWTFNSIKAFTEQFTWLTESQIKTCLINLHKAKLILVSSHNKKGYDRTKWYSIPIESTISEKPQMEERELANGTDRNRQPIPDNKPYISLLKIKMSDISISGNNLKYKDTEIEVTEKELMYFVMADKFRKVFIKNLKEKQLPTNHQEKAVYKSYVTEIRLMVENDGVSIENLVAAYDYLNNDDDLFWKKTVLSLSNLRKNITRILASKT